MKRCTWLLAAILLPVTQVALADSIHITVNSNLNVTVDSPNDNYWGEYRTAPDSWSQVYPVVADFPLRPFDTIFSNVSIFLPHGSTITSAITSFYMPANVIDGTGSLSLENHFAPPDLTGTSIAPVFGAASASIFIDSVNSQTVRPGESNSNVFYFLPPIVNGNEVSTGDLPIEFFLLGQVRGGPSVPGYNFDGYVSGMGNFDIPYSVQLDVTYTPVPEPASFVLLGTGALGLFGAARRKFFFHL